MKGCPQVKYIAQCACTYMYNICNTTLPLIVIFGTDILRYPNKTLSEIRSDIEDMIAWIMGNSISLQSWVPDQGTRINSARGQLLSCPRGTFVFGDVDGRLSGMRKCHLQLVSLLVSNVNRKVLRELRIAYTCTCTYPHVHVAQCHRAIYMYNSRRM